MSLILAFCMVLGLLFALDLSASAETAGNWIDSAVSNYAGGTGTMNDPYQIATTEQLAYLAKQVNAGTDYSGIYFKQTAAIDLAGKEWTPIGYFSANYSHVFSGQGFKGTYDGGDYTISNLSISSVNTLSYSGESTDRVLNPIGLFGMTQNCVIKNIYISGVDISISSYSNSLRVGALIGETIGSTIINCGVSSTGTGITLGGSNEGLGGLIGELRGTASNVTYLANCYTNLPVSASAGGCGGITGCHGSDCIMANCYARGDVTASSTDSGGGLAFWNFGNISNCYATGKLNGAYRPVARNTTSAGFTIIGNSAYYLSDTSGSTVSGYTGIGETQENMQFAPFSQTLNINRSCVSGLMPANITLCKWKIVAGKNDGYPEFDTSAADASDGTISNSSATFSGGDGSQSNPYQISCKADMIQYEVNINSYTQIGTSGTYYSAAYYIVTKDIDMGGVTFTPIGLNSTTAFSGSMDFQNHVILNYTPDTSTGVLTGYGDLLGVTSNSTISNYAAAIIGKADSDTTLSDGTQTVSVKTASGTYEESTGYSLIQAGEYLLREAYDWSGTVTPSKVGVAFTPASRTYNNIKSNQTGQDYTTSLPTSYPTLTATADNEHNCVGLSWTPVSADDHYMVYQKDSGETIYQSIPVSTNIKVLNVYPDTSGSDSLQGWMNTATTGTDTMGSPTVDGIKYSMTVDKISLSVFNGTDSGTNYLHYLTKNSGGYDYDVIYFGAWDANNNQDLSDAALTAVKAFIDYGGGCLLGHDTESFTHTNFITLAKTYLNLDVDYVGDWTAGGTNSSYPPIGAEKVLVHKKGLLTNYPYSLGEVGTVLTTPLSHSYYEFAMGDVWFTYQTNTWSETKDLTGAEKSVSKGGAAGTNNFYLTTWNNCAAIQTGHSNGTATVDEQKILTNTLYYLAQVTKSTSATDHMAQDLAAPDAVDSSTVAVQTSGGTTLSWTAPSDNGSTYDYYVREFTTAGGSSHLDSDTKSATVTTGVAKYYYLVDQNSANPSASTVKTENHSTTVSTNVNAGTLSAGNYYVHILTIDGAGNESAVTTASFTVASAPPVAGSGDALSFDGSKPTYVSVPSNNAYTTSNFTVEAWMQYEQESGKLNYYGAVISKGYAGSWSILTGDFNEHAIISRLIGTEIKYSFSDNGWHYVTMTYDGADFCFYIDGSLFQEKLVSNYSPTTSGICFGANLDNPTASENSTFNYRAYSGNLDEVKLWKTARTPAQIQDDMYSRSVSDSALVGYWSFDKGSGTAVTDLSAAKNNGTLTNAGDSAWVKSDAWQNRATAQDTALVIDAGYARDGGSVTLAATTTLINGTLDFSNTNKTVTYTPTNGYYGPDTFTYSVTNSAGVSNSYTVNMTVVQNPVMTGPADVTAAAGASAAFTVTVSAPSSGLTHQWQKLNGSNWDNITNATGTTYTIGSVAATDAGQYLCVVTATDGVAAVTTSSPVTLTVTFAATVNIKQDGALSSTPVTGTVEFKQSVDTKATLTGNNGTYTANVVNGTYDVYVNGEDTGVDITINNTAASAEINYYKVSFSGSDAGAASSSTVTATAGGSSISSGATVLSGKTVVLTATGAGADAYTYKWSGEGTNNETAAVLTITPLSGKVDATCTVTGSASYTVTLNTNGGTVNSGNVTSYAYGTGATLPTNITKDGYVFGGWYASSDFSGSAVTAIGTTEKGAKTFNAKWVQNPVMTGPADVTAAAGASAAFTVTVSAPSTGLTYQWQKYDGSAWNNISSATATTYTISSVTAADAGKYQCIVTATDGIAAVTTSDTATLTVTYTVTVTNDGNGTGSASSATATLGDNVTLTATPATGYHFKEWQIVSGGVTITDNKFTMPAGAVEVKAVFEKTNYSVTVTSDGNGTGSASPATATLGDNVTLTATPATGYHFKEWQIVSGGVTITSNTFSMPAGAVEVKAIFEKTNFSVNVTDDGNGTGSASPTSATLGDEVTLTATPSSGYHFKEWQVPTGGVTIMNSKFTMPAGTVDVKAIFEKTSYSVTVTDDGNGTGSASSATATLGDNVTLTATPATGYRFKEWQIVSGGVTITSNTFSMPAGAVEVKAVFEKTNYSVTVTSDGNGTGSASSATATLGDNVTLTATPATGYHFKEWQIVSGGVTITSNTFSMPAGAVDVKAVFEKTNYSVTVTSDGNGTGSASPTSATLGDEVTLTATPSSGYHFKEWQVPTGGVTIMNSKFTMPAGTVDVKAIFEKTSYSVTVTDDGNGTGSASSATATLGDNVTLTAAPAIGYHFKEWQIVSGGVTITSNTFSMPAGAVEVKAVFEKTNYSVTVTDDGNGTGSASPATATLGDNVTLTAAPATGYHFKEWQIVSGGVTVTNDKFTMPASAVDVRAIFEKTNYSVTVTNDGNGTGSASPATATLGDNVTLTATPSSGYHFKEWQVPTGGVTITDNKFTMPAGAVEVKAVFEKTIYSVTVTDDGNGTGSASPATATLGDNVTLTAAPATGYHFKEWQIVSGGVTITGNKFTMPAGAVEVKAIFEKTAYSVTMTNDGNGTGSASPATVTMNDEVTLTATPSSGYHFKEWQVVSGGVTITGNKFTMPAGAVEVKAIFEKTIFSVTVTNDGNGTGSASPVTATLGDDVTLTATPSSGYHFKEWQVVIGGVTITGNKFTMPAGAVEVKAIFEKTAYAVTVTNDGNGAGSASSATATLGDEITLTATPAIGYHFKEWQVISGGVTITNNKFIMPAVAVEVKAIFEKTAYSVTVTDDGNGAGSASPASAALGEEVTLTANPSSGYHFKEWQVVSGTVTITDNKFTMPAGAVDVKAVFEINTFAATVNIRQDDSPSGVSVTVELKQSNGTKVPLTAGSNGVYTANVLNGTYNVFVNNEDTGKTITIYNAAESATLDYYTVSFSASNAGAASTSTVTAMAGGASITSGTAVLAGNKVVLTATGAGASYYSHFWSGLGANGETSALLTIPVLKSKVDALCTVTGRASPTVYSVSLDTNGGAISSGSITSYTYGVGAAMPTNVKRADSVFIGWYTDKTFSGSPVTAISATDTGEKTFYAKWNFDIGGVISDDDGMVLHGATVTIRGNNITPKSTTTDLGGKYSFSDIAPGEYNIVAFYNGVTKTIILRVTGQNISDANITMPVAGAENSVVNIAQHTPDIVVGYLNQQFSTPDDTYVNTSGNTVKLELAVEEKSKEEASGAASIQAQAGNRTIDMYLDMKLTKTQTGTDPSNEQLSSVDSLLKIIIPYDLSGKTNVVVYRVHEGTTAALKEQTFSESTPSDECYMVNTTENQVVLWVKKFSTYAIAYSNIVWDSGSSNHTITASEGMDGTISPSGSVIVTAEGLPYYLDGTGSKVFIGFAEDKSGEMKYIAPGGKTVLFTPNPKTFTDISGHWGKSYIDFVTEREIFFGTGNNIFSPDTGMTRAMFATVIGRLYERSYGILKTAGPHAFTDCDYENWYGSYIDWCSESGVIEGVGGRLFDPDREITRQEMAAILYRFAEFLKVSKVSESATLSYPDSANIANWAVKAALYCQETGIIEGRNGGNFAPQGTATRAEVAAILQRFIEQVI